MLKLIQVINKSCVTRKRWRPSAIVNHFSQIIVIQPHNVTITWITCVAPSVVALVYYSDEEEIFHGSGIVIESNDIMSIVLTSANLRCHYEVVKRKCSIASLKVIVYSCDGKSYEGKIFAYDCYYNLVAISFHSESPLLTATLAHVDDSMSVQFSTPSSELLPSHSRSCNLTPGYKVVVVARYFYMPFDLMAAPGAHCIGRCGCGLGGCKSKWKEVFKINCKIKGSGEGVALINHSGEIIGIANYGSCVSNLLLFLPINITYKWWEHYKKYGKYRRPFLGMEATNLYAADVDIVERLIRKFPSICEGVIIQKVMKGFCAEMAGLCVNDVIIECGGKTVHSFLEFFEIIWDKVGDLVELVVVRQTDVKPIHLKMLVADATPDEYNRWPGDADYGSDYYYGYYDDYY
ncbi:Trypsin-like peptidase domain protein [Heracleum sosnowskyi]|uniref:Trypsin-like peptidase domain protein n=1 Tax=Heracleum sosnowskyi TaxID=360622 RepID=A0AAD8HB54_9APIA|nr:Trypsin-like peptidase domain protein [Heracleum sosnowskyi]